MKGFCEKKEPGQDVFDKLTVCKFDSMSASLLHFILGDSSFQPGLLNNELHNLMPGLSAKVFRTYNASITLEQELPWDMDPSLSWKEKVRRCYYYSAGMSKTVLFLYFCCRNWNTIGLIELLQYCATIKGLLPRALSRLIVRLSLVIYFPIEWRRTHPSCNLQSASPTVWKLRKSK